MGFIYLFCYLILSDYLRNDKHDISVLLQNTFLYVISPPTPTLLWPIFLSRSDLFLDTPTGVLGPVVPCWFTELCKKNDTSFYPNTTNIAHTSLIYKLRKKMLLACI